MRKGVLRVTGFLALLACAASWAAPYGYLDLRYAGQYNSDTFKVWGGDHAGVTMYSGWYQAQVRNMTGKATKILNTSGLEAVDYDYVNVFCVDLQDWANTSFKAYDLEEVAAAPIIGSIDLDNDGFVGDGMGDTKDLYIKQLW
jgi:hypothetical protein